MAPKPGAAATIFHREEASQHDETWKSVGMGASSLSDLTVLRNLQPKTSI
jgi:hypothetical protein